MGTKTAVSFANIFMAHIETTILSRTVFKRTVSKRYVDKDEKPQVPSYRQHFYRSNLVGGKRTHSQKLLTKNFSFDQNLSVQFSPTTRLPVNFVYK